MVLMNVVCVSVWYVGGVAVWVLGLCVCVRAVVGVCEASDEVIERYDGDGKHRQSREQHADRKHPVGIRLHLRFRELVL